MLSEERKQRIRDHIFNRRNYVPCAEYYADKTYLLYKDVRFQNEAKANITAYQMDHFPACIDDDDLLAGRFCLEEHYTPEMEEELKEMRVKLEGVGALNARASNSTGHRVIDYEKLLQKGINGVLKEIEGYEKAIVFSDPACAAKRSFYRSCRTELLAAVRFAEKYRAEAERKAAETSDPERKAELERIAAAMAVVPAAPATTFFEALQSVWFVEFLLQAISGDTSLTGRPDNYLYPYYVRDKACGRIDDDTVMSLIEDLYFKHNMLYGSWPASIMVGGRDRNGKPNWNELSYMFVRAIGTTGLVNPSVSACYNEAIPEDLLDLCLEMNRQGYTRPALFNDDIVIKGLMDAGVRYEDACYYIHSTCVEITPIAASNIRVATPYINLNKGLEYILNDGKKIFGNDFRLLHEVESDIDSYDTFDSFYAKVKETIDNIIKGELMEIQDCCLYNEKYCASPFASCFLNDCLALGKDSGAGGARYNFIYPCFPGFINLIDSIAAIRKCVYEEKIVTLREIADAMRDNFEEEGRLRAFLLNKCPKFGNDIDEVDAIGSDLFNYIRDELKLFRTSIGGTFHPSYFAWIMHGVYGEQCAATPDGRRQAEALSECLGAVQGMDKNGPTALMRSVSKIEQMYGIGGIATNFRFSRSMMRDGFGAVREFVREFMRNGNFEMQFNVVDQETLLDAQKHPEKYRTLLVRIAGYSDYFVDLAPVLQNEVIRRLEHDNL